MDCKITSINQARRAMTLPEVMVAMGIGSLVVLALASLTMYSSRSLASMIAYTDLNQNSRTALDSMTKEIRQSRGLISATPTSLEFRLEDSQTLRYEWDRTAKTFTETKPGITNILLDDCVFWTNSLFQRTPQFNTWDLIPATTATQAKLIQLTWVCSRDLLNTTKSESVQSMKIVIRKKVN